MAGNRQVFDHRFNPFSATETSLLITGETHIVPAISHPLAATHWIRLREAPLFESPSNIVVYDATTLSNLTEVSSTPGATEFRVDYTYLTGWVELNAARADDVLYIQYKGIGSPYEAPLLNRKHHYLDGLFEVPMGDGSDGARVENGGGVVNLAPTVGGIAFYQWTDLSISNNTTLRLLPGTGRYMFLAIKNELWIEAGSSLIVDGAGGQGRASQPGLGGWAGGTGGAAGGTESDLSLGGAGGGGSAGNGGGGAGGVGGVPGGNAVVTLPEKVLILSRPRSPFQLVSFGAAGGGGALNTGGSGGGGLYYEANVLRNFGTISADGVYTTQAGEGGGGGGYVVGISNIDAGSGIVRANGAIPAGGGGYGTPGLVREIELGAYA